MIKDFINAWYEYKDNLEEYLRVTPQNQYDDYKSLVKLLFDKCINPYILETKSSNCKLKINTEEITVIDNGNYQGTQIFILHEDTYEPSIDNYIYTYAYYGSCSGCDALMGISMYSSDLPDEEQIYGYMRLLLNLLQRCNFFIEE